VLKLVLHNVLKHKLLYSLIGIVVALLSFYIVIGLNSVISISESLERALAENMTGDLIIASPKAGNIDIISRSGERELVPLEGWREALAFARGRDYVAAAAPRLRVPAMLRSEDNYLPVVLTGIDPGLEGELLPRRKMDEGEWISGGGQINLYYRHADYLSASVGDTLGVTVTTKTGYARFDTLRLVGNLDYADIDYYSEFAYHGFVTLDYLNGLLMNESPLVSEIHVRLGPGGSPARLERDMRRAFGTNFRFILPRDSSRLVRGIYRLTRFIIFFVMAILFAMAYLCSSFIVNLSVESRSREIGIYQAMGVRPWKIGLLFSGEFLVVMAAFAFVGGALAALVMRGLSAQGITATIVPLHLVFGRSILYIRDGLRTYLLTFLVLLLAFAGNAATALFRMARLRPAEIGREL
jgi:ABC-type lipoprotein release transport system permease subunit